jgi:uncharacterized membrane protein YfcA
MLVALGSFAVGVLGGAFGIGGGVFLVPFLVFAASLRPIEAVGVSLFCIIGTSAGSSSVTIKNGEANVGLALLLEPGLVIGAVLASVFAQRIADRSLLTAFAAMLVVTGLIMVAQSFRARSSAPRHHEAVPSPQKPAPPSPWQFLAGVTGDDATAYQPRRPIAMALLTPLAGAAAGLFGIGGGVITAPLVVLVGGVPIRATAATTSLSLMVSAAAAAAVHLAHGTVPPAVVAASLIGVIPGGMVGARVQRRLPERAMRVVFALLAVGLALSLVRRARG